MLTEFGIHDILESCDAYKKQYDALFQLNHMTIFLGYYLSPCNLWTIHDEKNFISVCQLLSTLQLGTGIAAFLWVFRRALYFQMKAAKVKVSSFLVYD